MNLLEMLTQKRTDPLSSFVAREKMIRRNPMKFVGDTATRLGGGDPDASVLDLVVDHETTPRTPDIIAESPDTGKKGNGKLKGAITDIGGMLASALSPEQKTPLQFAPMQRQEFMPIADPRFLKYAGGRKKGGPIRVGTYATVHDDEKVANLGDGQVEVIPAHEDVPTLNEQIAVDEDLGTQIPLDAPDEKIAINETPTTATVTEQVKQPTIADKLGAQINAYQDPDRYKKGSEFYDKKRNWKDALRSAGYGLLQSLASAPPTNDLGSLLGRAIGGAGTGAVLGATMDNVDEKMRDRLKLAQILPQYQQAYGMERQKKADDLQIENTRADNAINKLRIESALQSRSDAEKGKAVLALNKLRWFDPKNPTHAALAKRSGLDPEDLQGWDDRRPYTKNVAGVEYVYKDGAFTPSNLPVDEAKTLKDYTVEMPNGEKRTYKVSQKDAANFSTQMSALGARLAQSQSQFDATMNFRKEEGEKNRQLRVQLQQNAQQYGKDKTVQMYADGFKRWYQKENGRAPTQTEIDEYLKGYILPQFEGAEGEFIPN